jgi:hypothetical protein
MTTERDFDRLARAWLELGPDEAPDRVIAAVLQAADTMPQARPLSRRPFWRYPTVNRSSFAASVAVAAAIVVVGGLLLTRAASQPSAGGDLPAASPSSSANPAAEAASGSPSAQASPTPTQTSLPTPTVFKSDHYGYSLAVPAYWEQTPAVTTWDGTGSPGSDEKVVDRFTIPPCYSELWVFAAPTKMKQADYVTHSLDAAAAEHPCTTGSQKPETNEPITVDGEPGRLLTIHCGILVLLEVTVHNGTGVLIVFQDPNGDRTTDAEDRALFVEFLSSVRFAG